MDDAPSRPDASAASERGLTRSELLRIGAGGAILLGAGGALGPRLAKAAPLASPKKGGTMRIGIGGGGATDDFDAAHVNGPSATTRSQAFYETVTYLDGRFKLDDKFMCELCEPNKAADTWTVRLKPGLEFHNGKTATADDLLFSIRRILDPKSAAIAAGQLKGIDLAKTKKIDSRTVRFALKAPTSFFDQLLSDIVYLLPVGYDPKKPVSTGPWKFKSFVPARETVLERFPNYWGKPAYLDQIILDEIPDDTARVNALLSGQVDAINQVPFSQIPVLKRNNALNVVVSPTGGWNPITMRTDIAPFNDVRVRQAIRLCMDRKQAVSSALFGQGNPAADYYGKYDPCDSALTRNQDISKAKHLLKQAGKENLKIELVTTQLAAGIVEACQILAQNAKAAGITITVRNVDIGTFFGQYGKWPMAIDYWPGLPYLVVASIADGPGQNVSNVTYFNDPEFNSLFRQASRSLDPGKRCGYVAEMQRIQYERGGYIIWSFQDTVDAYSKKVSGYDPIDETGWGLGRCQLHKLHFV